MLGTNSSADLWPLQDIAARWAHLLDLLEGITRNPPSDPAAAYSTRFLLIRALRLTVLRDPALPHDLLPTAWPEMPARTALANFYSKVAKPAQEHLREIVQRADGSLPGFVHQEEDWRFTG